MRSSTALALAAVLAVACSREDEAPPPREPPASSQPPQAAPAPAPELPSEEAVARLLAPWTGDLDGMVERRYVRVLVTFSRTNYFLDKAEQRGLTYEAGMFLRPCARLAGRRWRSSRPAKRWRTTTSWRWSTPA